VNIEEQLKILRNIEEELKILRAIAEAVKALPFGCHSFLPVCRESFPILDNAMKRWEKNSETN
jgi:hypothetical protein